MLFLSMIIIVAGMSFVILQEMITLYDWEMIVIVYQVH